MYDPLPKLRPLPASPTNADLASIVVELDERANHGMQQIHACLEDHKTISQNAWDDATIARANLKAKQDSIESKVDVALLQTNEITDLIKSIKRIGTWAVGIIFTAVVAGYTGLFFKTDAVHNDTIAHYNQQDVVTARTEQAKINQAIMTKLGIK